jgi:hypothetical protein
VALSAGANAAARPGQPRKTGSPSGVQALVCRAVVLYATQGEQVGHALIERYRYLEVVARENAYVRSVASGCGPSGSGQTLFIWGRSGPASVPKLWAPEMFTSYGGL